MEKLYFINFNLYGLRKKSININCFKIEDLLCKTKYFTIFIMGILYKKS